MMLATQATRETRATPVAPAAPVVLISPVSPVSLVILVNLVSLLAGESCLLNVLRVQADDARCKGVITPHPKRYPLSYCIFFFLRVHFIPTWSQVIHEISIQSFIAPTLVVRSVAR